MEDSKELAGAGTFGVSLHFHSSSGIDTNEFKKIMGDMLRKIGESVESSGHPIVGHIKAFIKTPDGFLKLNLIDLGLGVEETSTINTAKVKEGEIKIMAALVGIPDHQVQQMIGENVKPLAEHLQLEMQEHHEHHHEE